MAAVTVTGATVLGVEKRRLLKLRVLPAIAATNRGLQRVVNEYSEMLTTLGEF